MTMWKVLVFFGLLLAGTLNTNAQKIYDDPKYSFVRNASEAQSSKTYDYIIVGGGTTACPLAATLSQNFNVLLLERGGLPYGNPLVENLAGFYPNLLIDTPTSTSQTFISDDGVPNQRARVLGGGSAINAGFFTKPDADFVDEVGWNVDLVNSSFDWVSEKVAQFRPLQVFQNASKKALLEAGVTPNNGKTYEHLIGTKEGGSLFDDNGHRHSAADLLAFANQDNLDVLIWASVQKIIFEEPSHDSSHKATGVQFKDLDGNLHVASLMKGNSEVILSAGAMGSPQLLMLSGIGPSDQLAAFNISTIYENPSVGDHMADNPANSLVVFTKEQVEVSLIETVGITNFGSYIEIYSGLAQVLLQGAVEAASNTNTTSTPNNGTTSTPNNGTTSTPNSGTTSTTTNNTTTIARNNTTSTPSNTTSSSVQEDSKQGTSQVNAQVFMARMIASILSVPAEFRAQATWSGNIVHKIWGPLSKGSLRLASSNVDDTPKVRFNYFQNPQDLDTCEQGIRTTMNAINAPSLAALQYTNTSVPDALQSVKMAVESTWPQRDFENSTQDSANIRQWCQESVQTIWHYHGGCIVGKVVDNDYRVLNVKSLRVIDGSTFRRSPGTNPAATLMMLGRYMGQQILRERLQPANC